MVQRFLPLVLCAITWSSAALAQNTPREEDAIVGTWLTADGKARIQISRTDAIYWGKIVWLREPLKEGKPVVDTKNPDEKLQSQPVLGMTLMRGFEYDGDHVWSGGKVYDPDSGNDYSGKITLVNDSTLDLRGYVLVPLFGRTETWTRLHDPPPEH